MKYESYYDYMHRRLQEENSVSDSPMCQWCGSIMNDLEYNPFCNDICRLETEAEVDFWDQRETVRDYFDGDDYPITFTEEDHINYTPTGTLTFGDQTFNLEDLLKGATEVEATDKVADAVNPAHYKEIVPGYEAIDIMEALTKNFSGFEGYLAGQVYKYMFRLGKKDAKIQDAKKAQWYLNKLISGYEKE